MKPKTLLVFSLVLNLVLAGWILRGRGPGVRVPVSTESAGHPTSLGDEGEGAPGPAAARTGHAPGRGRPSGGSSDGRSFGWRQVESEDYRQYLANLRAIGCPEKTVRDIVVADVNDLFASRAAGVTRTNEYRFWRNEPVARTEDQERQLRDLAVERREVLRALGFDTPDLAGLLGERFRETMHERDLEVAFLPESRRQQVQDILFRAAEEEMAEGDTVAGWAAIEREALGRIESLLTPEEFREYELRASLDARKLRGTLDSLALTEQEFRAIFDAWRRLGSAEPGTEAHGEIRRSSEALIQGLLGPDRFRRYLEGVRQWGYPEAR